MSITPATIAAHAAHGYDLMHNHPNPFFAFGAQAVYTAAQQEADTLTDRAGLETQADRYWAAANLLIDLSNGVGKGTTSAVSAAAGAAHAAKDLANLTDWGRCSH